MTSLIIQALIVVAGGALGFWSAPR